MTFGLLKRVGLLILCIWIQAGIQGCSQSPVKSDQDPGSLLAELCSAGDTVSQVRGSAWVKAKSKEASGQFPAMIDITGKSEMKMVVTNLLGGTEAVLTLDVKGVFHLEVPGRPEKSRESLESWGGIPLRFARELYLGHVPCPDQKTWVQAKLMSQGPKQKIEVLDLKNAEKYTWTVGRGVQGGKHGAESLRWEKAATWVEMRFDDPEETTRAWLKWDVTSSAGEVKSKWKEREVLR